MNASQYYRKLIDHFPFAPTQKQEVFFQLIAQYITQTTCEELFVLKGYAGTGKTTLVSALVHTLPILWRNAVNDCIDRWGFNKRHFMESHRIAFVGRNGHFSCLALA